MDEDNSIMETVLGRLLQTPFACSSLTKLTGGTANFLYRGRLLRPLKPNDAADDSAIETVVVKHSEEYSPGNKEFPLDILRCSFERDMLQALSGFSSVTSRSGVAAITRSPRLYAFHPETRTQIHEDCSDTTDLKTILTTSIGKMTIPSTDSALSIGYHLGSWLRSFHQWSSEPEQAPLQHAISENTEARKLRYRITYGGFLGVLKTYPELVQGHLEALERIEAAMKADFEVGKPVGGDGLEWGLIHGDLWSGNVLVRNAKWHDSPNRAPNELFIIDWEMAQVSHRAIDIGGILADLVERKHFENSDTAIPIMKGFIEGYGRMSDEMAFRTAVHVGVHFICWHIRRNPNTPLPAPMERVLSALAIGRDLILKGWERDWMWLRSSVLAPMFDTR